MEYTNIVNDKYREIASRDEIFVMYRVELLDHSENVLSSITDLVSAENTGNISINYQQGVRRSCTISILDVDGEFTQNIINGSAINQKFKIYIGLKDIFNNDIYWFSQGVFCSIDPTVDRVTRMLTLNGVDKYGFLGSETGYNQITAAHVIPVDTEIQEAIQQTLMLDLGNGRVIDAIPPIIDNTLLDQKMPYEMEKAPASYLSDIFIELGNIMGADTYYDVDGHMKYDSGTLDMSYSQQDSQWDFYDTLPEYLNPSLLLSTTEIVNSVTIVGNNSSDDLVFTYTAENHNPMSPVSIENIGRKEYYEESSSVYDDSTAKDYAEYVLKQKSILNQAITFECTILPHLDVNKVITISDSFYGFNQERFIIQSIEIPLSSMSTMQVSAANVSSLPYYEFREGSINTDT